MLRAVFFDLDDTLCDARPAFQSGLHAAFRFLQQQRPDWETTTLQQAWEQAHKPLFAALNAGRLNMAQVRDQRFRSLLNLLGMENDALADAANTLLGQEQLRMLRLFEEARILDVLRSRFHVGIITNGAADDHADSQYTKIRHLQLHERVDSVWISDAVGYRKPDPRIFQIAAEAIGISCRDALFVGDNPEIDIVGAKAAGMQTAWLHHGASWPETIADIQPEYRIASLGELLSFLPLP
jgi:putative hydrolase of the HAD superfamily